MDRPWEILVVDDEPLVLENTEESLHGLEVDGLITRVTALVSFEEALLHLERQPFDVLVLDIRDEGAAAGLGAQGADSGLDVYEQVCATQFLPVVFFTGLTEIAPKKQHPMLDVVSKTDEGNPLEVLRESVTAALRSGLPQIERDLRRLVAEVSRDFMYGFVKSHWQEFSKQERDEDVAFLLQRRLAHQIGADSIESGANGVHPMRYYVTPPVGDPTTGELLRRATDSGDEWWVVLTPSCDLVRARSNGAVWAVLARCTLATEAEEVVNLVTDTEPSNTQLKAVNSLIGNNRSHKRDRYFFLPGVLDTPSLVVDFEQLASVQTKLLSDQTYERITTLDSPYAESLVNRFQTHMGRVGTPDLDRELALTRLRKELDPVQPAED